MARGNRFRWPLEVVVRDAAAGARLARLAEQRFVTDAVAAGRATTVRLELDVMVEQPLDRSEALRSALDLIEDWVSAENVDVSVTFDSRTYLVRAADVGVGAASATAA